MSKLVDKLKRAASVQRLRTPFTEQEIEKTKSAYLDEKKVPKFPNSRWFGKKLPKNPDDLPIFVLDAMNYVEEYGINVEGIFRISANKESERMAIEELENSYNGKVDFSQYDVHVAANLLKLYFRELPEPLLTYENYGMFIAASGIRSITSLSFLNILRHT